jgi:biopolymer transport protein ExbD
MKRARPAISAPAADFQPIASLNTTPLIDVMLVLLIVFIITIPLQTHKVKIDLPIGGDPLEEPQVHRLTMDSASRLSWDGERVSESALRERLATFRARDPEGQLLFQVDAEARYEDFDRVLADVKRARIERLGFVGNERHAAAF